MKDEMIRQKIHRAVDVYGAALREDPFLAQRILLQNQRKEGPRVKKLSTGAIIAIVLMLLSVTALAAVLTVEEIWQQSFEKMGTMGVIRNFGEPTQNELTTDEAIAIARKAIQDKYATPDAELDAMGLYPTYIPTEVTDKATYPAEWEIYFSSRTNVDLDIDTLDYGLYGEYRVYIDAATGEVTYCNWYCSNFWTHAQRLWDAGKYDLVYSYSKSPDFYTQSRDMQDYWHGLLKDKGYEVIAEDEKLFTLMRSSSLDLKFCELSRVVSNDDPQAAAAWQTVEARYGYDAGLLQKFAYVATRGVWDTGTDDICIHYCYELEWSMMETGHLDTVSDWLFSYVDSCGMFMVSFEPGTTNVAAVTRVTTSDVERKEPLTDGPLLARNEWTAADLTAFNDVYDLMNRAVKRMQAANQSITDIRTVANDYLYNQLEGDCIYEPAPEDVDVDQWFAEESEWDALIAEPEMTYDEFVAAYGADRRFWPMEVMVALEPDEYRMPNEGETTIEQAIQMALDHLAPEQGVTDLTGYTISCHRVSLTDDPAVVDCRWEVYIADDPANPVNGWKIHWGEWEDRVGSPFVLHITAEGNG